MHLCRQYNTNSADLRLGEIRQRQTSQQAGFGRKRQQNQRGRLGEMAGRKRLAVSRPFGIIRLSVRDFAE